MRFRTRRRMTVALLPLLVLFLSGFTAPGGWFCANGRQCEPALSAGCCCETERCEVAGAPEGPAGSLAAEDCGCYFSSPSVDAAASAGGKHFHPARHVATHTPETPLVIGRAAPFPELVHGLPPVYRESHLSRGPPNG